jgi:hypothetical protein
MSWEMTITVEGVVVTEEMFWERMIIAGEGTKENVAVTFSN